MVVAAEYHATLFCISEAYTVPHTVATKWEGRGVRLSHRLPDLSTNGHAFGIAGRRNCIGESLATMELFIFFAGLIQKFTFRPPLGVKESELDTTAEVGFTMRPHPQCAHAVPRQ